MSLCNSPQESKYTETQQHRIQYIHPGLSVLFFQAASVVASMFAQIWMLQKEWK